ncbi:nop53 protein isoform X2 [Carex rostrata]
MGKMAKGSRKGKKAWRANISTADIEDYMEKVTRDSLSGASQIPSLPDDSLFFLQSDTSLSNPQEDPNLSKRKKTDIQREKPLRHESVLQKNPFVRPLPPSSTSKHKPQKRKAKQISAGAAISSSSSSKVKNENGDDSDMHNLDIWNDNANEEPQPQVKKAKKPSRNATPIPAVEIESLGCSFNPPFEAHQDALAKAVADEMRKLYNKELEPAPVPLTVAGEVIPEEERFFLDADDGIESDDEDINEGEDLPAQRKSKKQKVTRVQLNRRARRKELLRAEAEAKKIENLSKEIDSLPEIMKEIEKEDEEKDRRHTRRVVAKQERLRTAPPRLGKPKYVPPPAQVLLTEEITGSLRKLKG